MTIQERLKRSNLIMLVVPVLVAGVLMIVALVALVLMLELVYLPRLGLTLHDLHDMGEEVESAFKGLKGFIVLYAGGVVIMLLAAVVATNLYLTKALFAHIQTPLNTLVQGVQRIQEGDLDSPIGYEEPNEFKLACDAVDEMAARLKESLTQQQQAQQKKQELIAQMSHDLKTPLTVIRAYSEALMEQVAPDEATRQHYLETIHAREGDLEVLADRLFEEAREGSRGTK